MCWRCKHHQSDESRSPPPVAYIASENPKMVHTREGAIRARQSKTLGQRTVGFQDPVGKRGLVMDHEMQNAFASALLDQLEDLSTDVKEHNSSPRLRINPPHCKFKYNNVLELHLPSKCFHVQIQ